MEIIYFAGVIGFESKRWGSKYITGHFNADPTNVLKKIISPPFLAKCTRSGTDSFNLISRGVENLSALRQQDGEARQDPVRMNYL